MPQIRCSGRLIRAVVTTSAILVTLGLGSGSARAEQSSWSSRAALLDGNDASWWCEPTLRTDGATGRQYGRVSLKRIASNGSSTANVSNAWITTRVKVQCFANASRTGSSVTRTSGWSQDSAGDTVQTSLCPSTHPYAGFERCQLDSFFPFYAYRGTPCGNGIGSIQDLTLVGQFTGAEPEWPDVPLLNDTMQSGEVEGTDLGAMFFSRGQMAFVFGDTYSNRSTGADWRTSTLGLSSDFNAYDGNAIAITGWEENPEAPGFARELIWSPKEPQGASEFSEHTALPNAGVSITDANGDNYRYIWFFSLNTWADNMVVNNATIAYSKNDGGWNRPFVDDGRPIWPRGSHFTNGGIWFDRRTGWLYLFGVQAQMPNSNSGVRLAAVKAEHAKIMDRTQYFYWSGSQWVRDANGDHLESMPSTYGASADLIPASSHVRGEISIAYNSYANRYMLLFMNTEAARVELWQSSQLMWNWSLVPGADNQLPNGFFTPGIYAPLMHELYMDEAGRKVSFVLSHWDPVYNVSLWNFTVNANTKASCTP